MIEHVWGKRNNVEFRMENSSFDACNAHKCYSEQNKNYAGEKTDSFK
jgi:hypothetical protein